MHFELLLGFVQEYLYNAVKKISDIYSEGISIDEASLVYNQRLVFGDEGFYVRALNYYLNVIAYFDDDLPFLDLKGEKFNENTKQAVIAFQEKYGLISRGIVGPVTWKYLRDVYRQTIDNLPKEYLIYLNEFFPQIYLSRGMSGDDVLNLQKFLYVICENTKSIPGVVVNGEFDYLTEQSVKKIQRDNGFEVNGIVGPSLWYKIVELSKTID